jgi:hypothetical protein
MTCPAARPTMHAVTRPIALLLLVLVSCGQAPSGATVPSPSATAPSPTELVTPPPSPARTLAARVMSEAQVWAEVRAGLPPGTPVAMPTWLPAPIDRDHVELRDLSADPADPRYVVAYLAGKNEIVFALGQMPEIAGSGYGMRVRGVPATLTFPISLWSDAATPATRRVRWIERGRVLSISSDTFTGDDLLHVAWSLDPTGQPAPANIYTRLSAGACATAGGAPEDTVRALMMLTGRHQRDAVLDCFANEYIGEYSVGVGTMWADLPEATLRETKQVSVTGGRPIIQASWAFATDPGGAWGDRPTRFFDLGLDSGRWRIHAINSAPIGPPP